MNTNQIKTKEFIQKKGLKRNTIDKYYTKPKEIDAQYYGFKRMAKITGKPFNELVVNWFKKNKDIHQMNDTDVLRVIRRLLSYTPKT